jgi:ankyrin repeat protein
MSEALADAVREGRFDEAESLLAIGVDPTSALSTAVEARNPAFVRRLLELGADPNFRDATGDTAVLIAANGNYPVELRMLLDRGGDPNVDNDGWTPLRRAARNQSTPIVALLLGCGARTPQSGPEWARHLDAFVATVNLV